MTFARITLTLAFLSSVGCAGNPHLWDARGRAYRDNFDRQRLATPAGTKRAQATTGLDSQEATIIADGYRRSLAAKSGGTGEAEPILLVAPQQVQQRMLPPPSVPRE